MAESTAIVKITPISGSKQQSAPFCYLLEVDQAKILLDCGTTTDFSIDHLVSLRRLTRSLDLVLLSHCDLQHCGALPWLLSTNSGVEIHGPVLSTVPVHHLGLVTLYDAVQGYQQATGHLPKSFSLDDVDRAFESIVMLKYSQTYSCSHGNAKGITVTPLQAGYSLGGAIWRIRRLNEDIFYAIGFNHKREMLIDGAALDVIQRPSLLIGDAKGALDVHPPRKERDTILVDTIQNVLKAGGSVLLPTDTASRSLELLQVLESHWNSNRSTFPILFLSHQSGRTLDLVRGMLEWMSQSIAKVFEQDRSNAFDFRFIRACHSVEEVRAVVGPKVILATMETLNGGFSRVLLEDILSNPASMILFTGDVEGTSLAARIIAAGKGSPIALEYFAQVPLEGSELETFLQTRKEDEERVAAEAAFAEMQRRLEDEEDEEEEEDESGESTIYSASKSRRLARKIEQEQINSAVALRHIFWTDYRTDWYIDPDSLPARLRKEAANNPFYPLIPPNVPLANSSGIPTRYQQFPFREVRRQTDNYGESLDKMFEKSSTSGSEKEKEAMVPSVSPIPTKVLLASVGTQVPKKWTLYSTEIIIKCNRKVVDFSGISDGKSLRTIYTRIQPRRLVLVGGNKEATEYLYTQLGHHRSISSSAPPAIQLFAPSPLESVTVSAAVNVMQVMLSESLVSSIDLQLLGDFELALVRGHLRIPKVGDDVGGELEEEDYPKTDGQMKIDHKELDQMKVDSPGKDTWRGSSPSSVPHLEPLSPENEGSFPPHHLLLGDPRLSEVRKMIQSELRIPAYFESGDLICGTMSTGRIAIKRDGEGGRLCIEGPVCQNYFTIRNLIYSTTAFV